MKKYLSILSALLAVISLAGCSKQVNGPMPLPASSVSDPTPDSPEPTSGSSAESYSCSDIGGTGIKSGDFSDVEEGGFAYGVVEEDCAVDAVYDKAAGAVAGDTAPSAGNGMIIETGETIVPTWDTIDEPDVEPQAGLLTGGEWNDNDHWSDWNNLYSTHEDWNQYKTDWKQVNTERIAVTVTDSSGNPLEGAKVTSQETTSAVTDNKGRAYVFHKSTDNPISLTVTFGDKSETVSADGQSEVSCKIDAAASAGKKLDLMIMCDTTGSMGDELEYLKEELKDIVTKIKTDNANIPTRISVNFYRDTEDEYEVRQFPFWEDIDEVVKGLSEQSADGGGDFPEAVDTALDSALNNHDWDEDSVKIMFMVLDAPPHDDAQTVDRVNKYIEKAAEMGVRIVPIASSGIDKSTEYLLRTMAFTTGGTYTFLTDDSGIGGGHLEPTVGAYNVEKLNDMMVRIVNSYLE